MRYKRKIKQNRKKLWSALSCRKDGMCVGKKKYEVNIHKIYRITKY